MHRIVLGVLMGLLVAACSDPESERTGEPPVEPVNLDTLAWVAEGRTVEYLGARWGMVGPPVYDPLALTLVGEFEGTPLYAERGVADPPARIYIPLGGGYWQMLERLNGVEAPMPMEEGDTLIQPGTEGVAP